MKSTRFVPTVLIPVLVFLLLAAGCSSSPTNESGSIPTAKPVESASNDKYPAAVQAILEAGKQEGQITFFGITTDPGAVQKFEGAIEKFYGFPIKVKMISGLHPQKGGEIIAAAKAGVKSDIDIFYSATNTLVMLDKADLLADVTWSKDFELDTSYDMLSGKALRLTDRFLANVMYNTSKVPKGEEPKSYDDLLDPKWKGKIVMPRTTSPFAYIAGSLGEDYAEQFVKELAKQEVTIIPKFPDVNARIASGEFSIAIGVNAEQDMRRGAPVANAPLDPVVITPWGNSMMKDAANPNAAKLVTYFMVTPEGQRLMDELWAVSLGTIEGTASYEMVVGKKTIFIPDEFIINKFEEVIAKYSEIMGIK